MCLVFYMESVWSNSYLKKKKKQIITPDEGSVIICNLKTGRTKAEITYFKVTRGTGGSWLK